MRRGAGGRRVLVGGISHETNTFSHEPTDLAQFHQRVYIAGYDLLLGFGGTRTVIGGFLDGLHLLGATPVPLLYASATPGGVVTRAAHAALRGTLLDAARAAMPVDGVLLALHGAMVAEDAPDVEGELLRAVRGIVGPDVPIIATLDSHANISPLMVSAATALVGYTTYPHIDTYERGEEAASILAAVLLRRSVPTMALATPPLLVSLPPQCTQPLGGPDAPPLPMRTLLARAAAARTDRRVLNVTVAGGFPYSDVRDAGLRVTVTTKGDMNLAHGIAASIASVAWAEREQFVPRMIAIPDALARVRGATRGPLVLADSGDNPGAGAPCDGTALLHALLDDGARGVAVGVIADAETVARAVAVGVGASLPVRLGGGRDDRGGPPVEATATVVRVTDGVFTHTGPMGTGSRTRMGRTVVLAFGGTGGVQVIVTEQRTQALDLSLFRSVGIEPTAQRAVVVKSSVHFRAAFAPIAAEILDVDTPGVAAADLTRFPYAHVRRPVWPLDPDATYAPD